MGLTPTSSCVKYLLFVFNLIFLITGIAVLSVGGVVQSHYNKYYSLLDDRFFSVPALLIATGVIILTISFFGCCGAVKENHCMIITFSALLILIFILELAAGIAGYVLEDVAADVISQKLNATMPLFLNDTSTRELWKETQSDFQCCGVSGPKDWARVFGNDSLPLSCCPYSSNVIGMFNCTSESQSIYNTGCLDSIKEFVVKNAVALGGVGVGIAFVQFLGIILACCLAHSIRKNYETV